jgi:hypothetical protein
MAYDDHSEFPRSYVTAEDVTNSASPLLAAGQRYRISHIVVSAASGAAERLTFRTVTGSETIFDLQVLTNRPISVIRGWLTDTRGLECLTGSAATNLTVAVFYRTD